MQISENSTQCLKQWKQDIELKVHNNPECWNDLYPLYSQVSFWLNKKLKEEYYALQERKTQFA